MATFSVNSSVTSLCASWAVIAALRRELRDLRRLARKDLVFLEAGVGTDNAAERITRFLDKQKVDFVLGTGMAGALSPHLGVGDLVIVERVIGPSTTLMSWPQLCSFAKLVRPDGVDIHWGVAVTTNEFICKASRKRSLAGALGVSEAGCVDMESWAVARVCTERRIPFLIVRAISDGFEEDLPLDFNRCRDSRGDLDMLKLGSATLRRPGSLKGLWQLRGRSILCSQRLAWFVDQFLAVPEVRGLTGAMRPSSNSL
jgi:adenosylhomocysteine nucleosidase